MSSVNYRWCIQNSKFSLDNRYDLNNISRVSSALYIGHVIHDNDYHV